MMGGQELSGVLIVNKPSGMTSHDVVSRVRKLYSTKKIGHTGTLDPLATGVLPVLVGRAVKAAEYLSAEDKTYTATVRFGCVSDTEDIDGRVSETGAPLPSPEKVKEVVSSFRGAQTQIPPMYSALKVDGQKLVDIARRGEVIERQPRPIEISKIEITPGESEREYTLYAHVSKGTYIRTLAADIGKKLGCGAIITTLKRERSGNFLIENSHTLDELEALDENARAALLLPAENLFAEYPAVTLPDFYAKLAKCGCEIYQKKISSEFAEGNLVRMYDASGFFALGEVKPYPDGSAIKAVKLFVL